MDKYTAKAPTVEEAINKALRTLGISKEEASIEVIENGKKGFLGFGQKDAIVTVRHTSAVEVDHEIFTDIDEKTAPEKSTIIEAEDTNILITKENDINEEEDFEEAADSNGDNSTRDDSQAIELVSDYLVDVVAKLGAQATINVEQKEKQIIFHLDSQKAGVIIGKHGKVLNALQSLAQVLLHRHAKTKMVAVVNVGDYRERREVILKRLAERTASKVEQTNQPVFLEPMPAFERKVIHYYLSQNEWVTTHSEGREPHRYLVVEPSDKQI
ncbi:protein jag [Desemzia sp. RIT804]|uniref:RNA-binding cell elongation regulator Jag/EloR n=1 Tax=Desemzia sp. RIT 804 TaxID=2810209 RepID=UPI00194E9C6B|nr:RNA-binding cell elongation regulator Jag/EloR [Desemzia sp. RIT 804]MBM6615822.1 protein jag [Desemzia sp. RIT 804]